MKVILDANVLASEFIGHPGGPPARVVAQWARHAFALATSVAIRAEVERTLAKPYFARRASVFERDVFLTAIDNRAEFVSATIPVAGVASHPEDDRVLEAAVAARADYLVTGDRGLPRLGAFDGIPILDPRAFLAVLEGTDPRDAAPTSAPGAT